MVTVLRVDVRGIPKVRTMLKRVGRFPEMGSKAMMEWGTVLQRDMTVAARQAKIRHFTGRLRTKQGRGAQPSSNQGIKWVQRPAGKVGKLTIREEYVNLSEMDAHHVALKKTRTGLMNWAKQAQKGRIREGAERVSSGKGKYAVYVRRHQFIEEQDQN